jgi:hypothetical protein
MDAKSIIHSAYQIRESNMHFKSTSFINIKLIIGNMLDNMPPRFFHFGPPLEEMIIELVYFLLVLAISCYIYIKTKEIYELTKHKGIYHFRNIFFYFGMAYLFRLSTILMMFSGDLFNYFPPRILSPIIFTLVSYFSTLAIFSVLFSISEKHIKISNKSLTIISHILAIGLSLYIGFIRSQFALMIFQTLVFFIALIIAIFKSKKEKNSKLLTQNKVTFVLLFVFWVINTLAFTRRFLPTEIKVLLYMISGAVFFSIFLRVRKRLVNAEKKRSP